MWYYAFHLKTPIHQFSDLQSQDKPSTGNFSKNNQVDDEVEDEDAETEEEKVDDSTYETEEEPTTETESEDENSDNHQPRR